MKISIIIPTYNEAAVIGNLIDYLNGIFDRDYMEEILIVDGMSTDDTIQIACNSGVKVIESPQKGRAAQMNFGARHARGEILYFLHADSYPPPDFHRDIKNALNLGFEGGCYRLQFDHDHWFLKANCWFTRFNINTFRFGDQSLYVNKELFFKAGAFKEHLIVMEDQEVIKRIRKHTPFKVFEKAVTTSARKYLENGIYRLQAVFFLIFLLYKIGLSQNSLVKVYRTLIRQKKV